MVEPNILHLVIVFAAFPKIISEKITSTMVSKLPTEVIIGPQTARRI